MALLLKNYIRTKGYSNLNDHYIRTKGYSNEMMMMNVDDDDDE